MGHRANFVIIENGRGKAFFDQWAALGSTYILGDGIQSARSNAESFEETDELLNWGFAEAGYLLDFDEKLCIVFGKPELPEEMEEMIAADELAAASPIAAALEESELAFLAAIAPRWPGWTLIWDERGVDAFSEHLTRRGIRTIKTQPPSYPPEIAAKRFVHAGR